MGITKTEKPAEYCKGYRDALIWVVKMLDADLFDNKAIRDMLRRGLEKYPVKDKDAAI